VDPLLARIERPGEHHVGRDSHLHDGKKVVEQVLAWFPARASPRPSAAALPYALEGQILPPPIRKRRTRVVDSIPQIGILFTKLGTSLSVSNPVTSPRTQIWWAARRRQTSQKRK
jgi:hypothetical protein